MAGLGEDDQLIIQLPNIVELLVLYCAISKLGANPLVMLLLADRLSGHRDNWSGFEFKGWRTL